MLRHVTRTRSCLCVNFSRRNSTLPFDADLRALLPSDILRDAPPKSGPLNDIRLAVKDNICTRSEPTTCSSLMLKTFVSPFDATVVALLRDGGAHVVGKANCDEFGMGSFNVYSAHGPVINPVGLAPERKQKGRRVAGGSSGGSAAAVAAGLCDVALGTDTGGSVRLPASYCGVVGLKPSYGTISRWGVISFADSLDCVGILGRAIDQVERVFGVASQFDDRDPTAAPPSVRKRASALCSESLVDFGTQDLSGLRIGVPQEYFPAELHQVAKQPLRDILAKLQTRGATVVPVSLPATPYALSAYYVISSAEASSNLARYDGIQYGIRAEPAQDGSVTTAAGVYAQTRTKGFGPEVVRRILLGTYALSASAFENYFLQAQRVRKLVRADFDRVFRVPNALNGPHASVPANRDGVHVLLHPSAIGAAPELEANARPKADSYVQDVLTVPASLAGLPALNVPAGMYKERADAADEDRWPIGVSVVGQWGCDEMVLKVGKIVEQCVES